jgi:hypothetical protein
MNTQKWSLLAVVVILTGITAAFLNQLQGQRKLGPPGLKTVHQPVYDSDKKIVGTNTIDLPLTVLNYTSKPLPVDQLELSWLPKDTTYGRRQYTSANGNWLNLSIVLMGSDRTSIHKPQICLDAQGWHIEKSELVNISMARPHSYELPVMKLTASKRVPLGEGRIQEVKAIYVYWFVSDRRLTARHGERMWWMATDLISTGILPRWAYVTCLGICDPGKEESLYSGMEQFISAAVPEFQLVAGPMNVAARSNASTAQAQAQN